MNIINIIGVKFAPLEDFFTIHLISSIIELDSLNELNIKKISLRHKVHGKMNVTGINCWHCHYAITCHYNLCFHEGQDRRFIKQNKIKNKELFDGIAEKIEKKTEKSFYRTMERKNPSGYFEKKENADKDENCCLMLNYTIELNFLSTQ